MTNQEWHDCLNLLRIELNQAIESGDEAKRIGTIMALEAFLSLQAPGEPWRSNNK
jgi:hypothetical protein